MWEWVTYKSALPPRTTARTRRECRLYPTSKLSGVLIQMHASMGLHPCHRRSATAVFGLTTLLAKRLSSTQIPEACQACQIPWLLRLRKVTLGLFQLSLSQMIGGLQAVASLAQGTHMFLHARTALPPPSIVASIPQTHIFPPVKKDWIMARIPSFRLRSSANSAQTSLQLIITPCNTVVLQVFKASVIQILVRAAEITVERPSSVLVTRWPKGSVGAR